MGLETDALIVSLAGARHGAISFQSLIDAGIAASSIRRRVGGVLQPFAKGVYLVGPMTSEGLLAAALMATPGSVASHRTAARLHQMALGPDRGVVHLSSEAGRRQKLPGVRIHRTVDLGPDDRTHRNGHAVTSLERTICDLAGEFHLPRLRHVAEKQIVDGNTSASELHGQIRSFVRRGRRGSTKLRHLAAHIGDEGLPGSVLEERMEEIVVGAGGFGRQRQFRPPWYDGVRGVVDFALPGLRLVIEADGRRWHAVTQAQEEDRRRDRLATRHGWTVLRFGGHEILHRAASLTVELGGLLAIRRAELAALGSGNEL